MDISVDIGRHGTDNCKSPVGGVYSKSALIGTLTRVKSSDTSDDAVDRQSLL